MKQFLLSLALVITLQFCQAQTVEDVIGKYEKAMGGRDKLNSIKSLHTVGVATMQSGAEINIETWKEDGKLFRRKTDFGMGAVTTLITDQGAWQTNFRNGGAFEIMNEKQKNAQLYELDCPGPLVDYAAKGNKAELLGKETVNGNECYKIKLTTKEGRELTYYIDVATNYIDRLSYMSQGRPSMNGGEAGKEIEVKTDFSRYDKTPDGYVFAFSVGQLGNPMTFETIEVNPKIEASLYKAN